MKDESKRGAKGGRGAKKAEKATKGGGSAKKRAKGGGSAKKRAKGGRSAKRAKKGTKTKLDKRRLKWFIDPKLIYALGHAMREHILAVLNERIASPAEVAREVGVGVTYVAYHFRQLKKKGFIELVKVEPRRGAEEHFYRAKATFFIDSRKNALLPAALKPAISVSLFQSIIDDFVRALRAITLDARDDRHVSWKPTLVDAQGFGDLDALLVGTLEKVSAIQAESAERMARTGEEAIPTTVGLVSFETPPDPAPRQKGGAATG